MPPTPIDQWRSLNVILKAYKIIGLILGIVTIGQTSIIFYLIYKPPIVVALKDGIKHFYYPEKSNGIMEAKDVQRFVSDYLHLRYGGGENIIRDIEPLTTPPFLKKEKKAIIKKEVIAQAVANVNVEVTDKSTIASFDRILRVKGIPIVVPTKASFRIVKDAPTRWNPRGLYIDGVSIVEAKP